MAIQLALFDLDNTLLKGDSDDLWSRYLMQIGILDSQVHQAQSDAFYQSYLNGTLDIASWLSYQLEPLTRYPVEVLHKWRQDFLETWIKPLVLPLGISKIKQHQANGDEVIIVTATNEFITAPIAEYLGVAHLIAPYVERSTDGSYTGKTYGTPSFKDGKITRLKEWLTAHNKRLNDFEKTWFYSDSHNDIPLLSIVTHPVAVNPDAKLLATAQQKQWEIADFRLETTLT